MGLGKSVALSAIVVASVNAGLDGSQPRSDVSRRCEALERHQRGFAKGWIVQFAGTAV